MYLTLLAVFIVGYLFIALEHSVKIDKAATALLTGTLCWVIFIFGRDSSIFMGKNLFYLLTKVYERT